jgi:hypothetical protein
MDLLGGCAYTHALHGPEAALAPASGSRPCLYSHLDLLQQQLMLHRYFLQMDPAAAPADPLVAADSRLFEDALSEQLEGLFRVVPAELGDVEDALAAAQAHSLGTRVLQPQ